MIHDPSKGAIARGSPGDCNSHAGKYGESTPSRQRGGGGRKPTPLPTHYVAERRDMIRKREERRRVKGGRRKTEEGSYSAFRLPPSAFRTLQHALGLR